MIKRPDKVSFDWKNIATMVFLITPFFRPTIINDYSSFAFLKTVFSLWLLASCVSAVIRFVTRNGKIDLFLTGIIIMLFVFYISTILHNGDVFDATIDSAMLLSAALIVGTLNENEVEAFLACLVGIVLFLVAAELVMRVLFPNGIYTSDGSVRWILENGSLQSRWCFILVFASCALDHMRMAKLGLLSLFATSASAILILQLSSATSFIAFIVEVVIIFFAGNAWLQRVLTCRKVSVVILILTLATVFFRVFDFLPYEAIATFLGKDLRYSSGATFTGRTYIWDSVIDSITQSPWLGYGYQQFVATDLIQFYSQTNFSSAHNLWLQIAFQGGLIGLCCHLLSYYSTCIKADSAGGYTRMLIVGLLGAFLVTSIFENTLSSVLILALAIPSSNVVLATVERGCSKIKKGGLCRVSL